MDPKGPDMKKSILLTGVLVLFSIVALCQVKKFQDIVGRWEIAGEQNAGASLEIIDSNNMVLTYKGETRKISNVKIDFSRSPAWVDFSATDSTNLMHVKSLMEVGTNVIKWQIFIDEERTPYFTSRAGEILYLKRAKPTSSATVRSQ
jgi:hypothetical protein